MTKSVTKILTAKELVKRNALRDLTGKTHRLNTKTQKNDIMKNKISATFGLPILRITTDNYPDNIKLCLLIKEKLKDNVN